MRARAWFWRLGLGVLALLGSGCERAAIVGRLLAGNFATLASPIRSLPARVTNAERKDARLAVLWVGHATVLIQLDDKFVLTDPVFTDTVGNISKRLVEPGIAPEHLPTVNAVLVSHMHLDHLSLGSLDLIEDKVERIYLPEGGVVYVPSTTVPSIELPSWQSHEVDGLRVTAVPVRHLGFRYAGDRAWMTKSFTGYVIEYHGLSVYFGGDTAYTQSFADTAQRFEKLDLALLPIAPIHPRSFMCRVHLDPSDALQAFADLNAKYMLPIHYDTFFNSLDEVGQAPAELRALLPRFGLDEQRVPILSQGDQHVFVPSPILGAR